MTPASELTSAADQLAAFTAGRRALIAGRDFWSKISAAATAAPIFGAVFSSTPALWLLASFASSALLVAGIRKTHKIEELCCLLDDVVDMANEIVRHTVDIEFNIAIVRERVLAAAPVEGTA